MRWLVAALIWISTAFAAAAQTQPLAAPAGWTVNASAEGWLASSPEQGRGLVVRMILLAPARASSPLAAWLEAESGRHTRSMGRVLWDGNAVAQDSPGFLSKGRTYVDARTNLRMAAFAWAYETPRGRQLAMILKPMDLAETNAAYQSALDLLARAWRARYAYAPPTQAASAAPAPAPAATKQGNCRREPVWGFRLSPFCQPSGVCPDRVIKSYETVCE